MNDGIELLQQKINELRIIYVRNLPNRIECLENVFQQFAKEPSNHTALENLLYEVHKLHGSAGTYGFDLLSTAAKEWELLFKSLHHDHQKPDDEQINCMKEYIRQIKELAEDAIKNCIT